MLKIFYYTNIALILFSCGHSNQENPDILLGNNSDTLQVTRGYAKNAIQEIIYYENNKPIRNIGLVKGDTLDFPSVIFPTNGDSLFIFYPLNKFRDGIIIFGLDSARALMGGWGDLFSIYCNSSSMLKIVSEMRIKKNRIFGAFKCKNPNGSFEFWPFDSDYKNNHRY
jgi:hypothetical protein